LLIWSFASDEEKKFCNNAARGGGGQMTYVDGKQHSGFYKNDLVQIS
jgi:hypothetical protein